MSKYGVWIPPEVYHNPDLSDGEKLLAGRIIALANGEGCTAGNSFLAEDMGKSQKHISEMISRLIKAGILEVEFIPKEGKRVLTTSGKFRTHIRKKPEGGPEKTGGPLRKKPEDPSGKIRNIDKEYRISNENKSESVPPAHTPPPQPKPTKPKNVVPPTFEMVTQHWTEKAYPGGQAGARIFFDFYEMKGWIVGKVKMKDWHAAANNASKWDRIVNLKKPNSGWNLRKEL